MNKKVRVKIIENNKYTKNSKKFKLIEFVNKYPLKVIEESISSISQKLGFSTSTLTRTVRKLGFKNYAVFRNFVVEKISENKKYLLMHEEATKSHNSLQNFTIFNTLAIEKTLNNIEEKNFETLINEIVYAKRILLFGIGFAHAICHLLAKNFETLNIKTCNISDFYHALRLIYNLPNDDVWIIISISLTTREVLFVLKELTLINHNKIILITSNDKNKILKKISYILKLKSANNLENEIFNFNYKAALTAIANLLINSVINKLNYNKVKQILKFDIKASKWKK